MAGQEPEWQRGPVRGAVWVVAKAAASTRSKTAATGGHRPGRGCRLTRVLNRSLQLSGGEETERGEGGSRSRARGHFWKSERWPDSVVSGEEGGGTVTVLGVPGWRHPAPVAWRRGVRVAGVAQDSSFWPLRWGHDQAT